ncbi:MAG: hypothetical protein IT176_09310 [Acidobacteria bacterium]|nr:hypothetical protein [Acidobacteriota bacterium]
MTRPSIVLAACLLIAAWPRSARAQDRDGRSAIEFRRFDLAVGGGWSGGVSYGAQPAAETPASGPQPFHLFTTSSRLDAAAEIAAAFGVRLTRRIEAEAFASFARPALQTAIRGGAEGGGDPTVGETLRRLAISAGLRVPIRLRPGAGVEPFVAAGAGYLRELHEGGTLVEGGGTAHAGAGLRIVPAKGRAGLRVDLRLVLRRGGAALDRGTHVHPAAAAYLLVRF